MDHAYERCSGDCAHELMKQLDLLHCQSCGKTNNCCEALQYERTRCTRCKNARARIVPIRFVVENDLILPLTAHLCVDCIQPNIDDNLRIFEEYKDRHPANRSQEKWVEGGFLRPAAEVIEALRQTA